MRKKALTVLLIAAGSALGQPAIPQFWKTPGETIRDAHGVVVRQEIKDPKTFTMRVFEHNTWVTYQYEPNTEKIIHVNTADTAEDLLYDGNEWNGVTLRAGGKSYTFRDRQGHLTATGLPPLSITRDEARDRDVAARPSFAGGPRCTRRVVH